MILSTIWINLFFLSIVCAGGRGQFIVPLPRSLSPQNRVPRHQNRMVNLIHESYCYRPICPPGLYQAGTDRVESVIAMQQCLFSRWILTLIGRKDPYTPLWRRSFFREISISAGRILTRPRSSVGSQPPQAGSVPASTDRVESFIGMQLDPPGSCGGKRWKAER